MCSMMSGGEGACGNNYNFQCSASLILNGRAEVHAPLIQNKPLQPMFVSITKVSWAMLKAL